MVLKSLPIYRHSFELFKSQQKKKNSSSISRDIFKQFLKKGRKMEKKNGKHFEQIYAGLLKTIIPSGFELKFKTKH